MYLFGLKFRIVFLSIYIYLTLPVIILFRKYVNEITFFLKVIFSVISVYELIRLIMIVV